MTQEYEFEETVRKIKKKAIQDILYRLEICKAKHTPGIKGKLLLLLNLLKLWALITKRHLWNKRLRLWWHKLWIREDEFHESLNMDIEAMLVMNKKEREAYIKDLIKRRDIAHRREVERSRKKK